MQGAQNPAPQADGWRRRLGAETFYVVIGYRV